MFGWAGALCLAALAFFLRRWHLGTPHAFVFDETYYAKDAFAAQVRLRGQFIDQPEGAADKAILSGNLDVFRGHPEPDRAPRGRQVDDRRR